VPKPSTPCTASRRKVAHRRAHRTPPRAMARRDRPLHLARAFQDALHHGTSPGQEVAVKLPCGDFSTDEARDRARLARRPQLWGKHRYQRTPRSWDADCHKIISLGKNRRLLGSGASVLKRRLTSSPGGLPPEAGRPVWEPSDLSGILK
jgi:hypothetical protein